ncbi:hypothetical protein BDR03DRAFT_952892 [Suillus americanus]|nr:hypothetical protein BDR03DRAFT_952892 [Suillus americanus]
MKVTSALVLSFIASATAQGTTIHASSFSGVPGAGGSSLSSFFSSQSVSLQSVISSITAANPGPTGTPNDISTTSTVTSPSSSGSTTSAQATTTSTSAAGRTEVGLGLAAGAAAGLLVFFF